MMHIIIQIFLNLLLIKDPSNCITKIFEICQGIVKFHGYVNYDGISLQTIQNFKKKY
jgi:hypothetical protein